MPKTYDPIQSHTLASNQSSVTFTSIPQTYTDLILVTAARDTRPGSTSDSFDLTFNTDTSTGSTNYSTTVMQGNGSSASSSRFANSWGITVYQIAASTAAADTFGVTISHIQNYSNTTTNKTVLTRGGIAIALDSASVGLWRSTAAINAITLFPGFNGSGYNFTSGSTFTLYGIKAA